MASRVGGLSYPCRIVLQKSVSHYTLRWGENRRRIVNLKGCFLNDLSMVEDEAMGIVGKFFELLLP